MRGDRDFENVADPDVRQEDRLGGLFRILEIGQRRRRIAGLHHGTVRHVDEGAVAPDAETVEKIGLALGLQRYPDDRKRLDRGAGAQVEDHALEGADLFSEEIVVMFLQELGNAVNVLGLRRAVEIELDGVHPVGQGNEFESLLLLLCGQNEDRLREDCQGERGDDRGHARQDGQSGKTAKAHGGTAPVRECLRCAASSMPGDGGA